jgi:hypothetical protein
MPIAITTTHPQSCPVLLGVTRLHSARHPRKVHTCASRVQRVFSPLRIFHASDDRGRGARLVPKRANLFSVTRFRELTCVYPIRITVTGHDFKRRLQRLALPWPKL